MIPEGYLLDEVVGLDVQVKLFVAESVGRADLVDDGILHQIANLKRADQQSLNNAVHFGVARVIFLVKLIHLLSLLLDNRYSNTFEFKAQITSSLGYDTFVSFLTLPQDNSKNTMLSSGKILEIVLIFLCQSDSSVYVFILEI